MIPVCLSFSQGTNSQVLISTRERSIYSVPSWSLFDCVCPLNWISQSEYHWFCVHWCAGCGEANPAQDGLGCPVSVPHGAIPVMSILLAQPIRAVKTDPRPIRGRVSHLWCRIFRFLMEPATAYCKSYRGMRLGLQKNEVKSFLFKRMSVQGRKKPLGFSFVLAKVMYGLT